MYTYYLAIGVQVEVEFSGLQLLDEVEFGDVLLELVLEEVEAEIHLLIEVLVEDVTHLQLDHEVGILALLQQLTQDLLQHVRLFQEALILVHLLTLLECLFCLLLFVLLFVHQSEHVQHAQTLTECAHHVPQELSGHFGSQARLLSTLLQQDLSSLRVRLIELQYDEERLQQPKEVHIDALRVGIVHTQPDLVAPKINEQLLQLDHFLREVVVDLR